MPSLRAQFQRTMFPGIREFIFRGYKRKPTEYSQIYPVMTSDSAFEEDYQAAGVGLFNLIPETTLVEEDAFYPGLSIRYTHLDYAKRIGFSHQFVRDGKVNMWNDRSRDMGWSANQTMEILLADMLNSGNTTIGYDNQPLFSASHPLIRGGTGRVQSNLLATPATLSVVSYRAMLTMFRRFFDPTGVRRIQLDAAKLIVPPELEWDAKEIVKSVTRPDTANRADNVSMNTTQIFVYDYLLQPKPWFIFADKSDVKIKVYEREKFNVMEYEREEQRMNWVQAAFAFSFGWSDYIGVVGTYPP